MAHWVKQRSKKWDREFWFNTLDGSSSWTEPSEVAAAAADADKDPAAKRARTTEAAAAAATPAPGHRVQEDDPALAIERVRLTAVCFDAFVDENAKYGEMLGQTKTAKSCRMDGLKVGMQGMFSRVIWTQLLKHVQTNGDIGQDPESDATFVPSPVQDEAVMSELVEAGRTRQQAEAVMGRLYGQLRDACSRLVGLRRASSAAGAAAAGAVALIDSNTAAAAAAPAAAPKTLYTLQCGASQYQISGVHLNKLLGLYRKHTAPDARPSDPLFLRRVYCVLARYELLSGSSDGYQMAFPDVGFRWLRERVGVTAECFASPLNCWNDRFCSVARDTDQFFGSLGNFFHFSGCIPPPLPLLAGAAAEAKLGGSFEANPPFVESIMNEMAATIEKLLEISTAPFSFVVVVPAWYDCAGVKQMTASRFLRPQARHVLVLEKKKHAYRPGMQHRAGHEEQPSNVDTLVFFLQNELGAARWPVTLALSEDLRRAVMLGQ